MNSERSQFKFCILGMLIFALFSSVSSAEIATTAQVFNSCPTLLREARYSAKGLAVDSYIQVKGHMTIPPGSVSSRMGLESVSEFSFRLPRAATANARLGLVEGESPLYILEIEVKNLGPRNRIQPGDIDIDLYHYLLSEGYLGITKPTSDQRTIDSFTHDILDHVSGYFILSTSTHWLRALRILKEVIYAQSQIVKEKNIKDQIGLTRIDITHDFELFSSKLSTADKRGDDPQLSLTEFSAEIERLEYSWAQKKSRFGIKIPDDASLKQSLRDRLRRFF